jgi:ABC-type multidrug transport system ATPase subunit
MAVQASAEEKTVIQVEHLTKRFGDRTAVHDVSFTVKEGEVFAMLGPNGSGKTTTMRSIIGLTIPTVGRIAVNGLDVQHYPREARHVMSYLPQRVVFPETMTARELVHFYARLRRLPSGAAEMALDRGDFGEASDRTVGGFSGGMTQRLGLVIMSLADAPVLLLDEPTASLDPQGVKRFREFVLHQRENGRTILFSTHLLAEAEQLADRVAIFVGGRLVALESTDSLRQTYLATKTIEDLYLHYVESYDDEEE